MNKQKDQQPATKPGVGVDAIVRTPDYDSTIDTLKHIMRVRELLIVAIVDLVARSHNHDRSKIEMPEKELYDKLTPLLFQSEYDSEEYRGFLQELKPALDHHYDNNSHHPEHYKNGIDGMNLFDLLEMFLDWKAATERHVDGNIYDSLIINRKRFNMTDQLFNILRNTAKYLNF